MELYNYTIVEMLPSLAKLLKPNDRRIRFSAKVLVKSSRFSAIFIFFIQVSIFCFLILICLFGSLI